MWQKLTTRPIKWRLTIAYVAIIYFAMTAVGLTLSYLVESEYTAAYHRILVSHARMLKSIIEDKHQPINFRTQADQLCRDLSAKVSSRVQLLSPNGLSILGDSRRASSPTLSDNPAGRLGSLGCRVCHAEARSPVDIYEQQPIVSNGRTVALVRVSSSLFIVKQASARARRIVFTALVLTVILAVAFSQRFASSIAGPAAYMAAIAKRMAEGDLSQRVKVTGPDEIGQLAKSFNTMADQLERMLGEMAEDRNKMATILTTMADGIIVTDESGVIMLFNKASEEVFGRRAADLIGRNTGQVALHGDLTRMVDETLKTGCLVRKELRLTVRGRNVTASAYSAAIKNQSSEIKGAAIVLHDLTEIRKHENAQREFVANVSHELRTPITSVRLTAEALLAGAKDDPHLLDRFLATLVKESERLSLLIDDLLEIAKREAGTRTPRKTEMELHILIARMVTLHKAEANQRQIALSFDVPEDLMLYADERQISQVVANLVDNAIKYTPQGGKVIVKAKEDENDISISVADTGIGIPDTDVARIFERFYRVDKARSRQMGGTGLGLSIVKDIVEAHEGTITVETEEDKGSTFTVTIPNSFSPPV